MVVRSRVSNRMIGLMVRWGLIKHPYGREYVRDYYTLSGRRVSDPQREQESNTATEAALVTITLLFLSLLATGILFG